MISFSAYGIGSVEELVEEKGNWDVEEEWGAGHKGYVYIKDKEKDTFVVYMFIRKELYQIRETYGVEEYESVYEMLVDKYGGGTGVKERMKWEVDNKIIWLTMEGEEVLVQEINKGEWVSKVGSKK